MQRAPIQSFSTSEALDLLRQGSGSAYFVPTGYIPILVPDSDEDPDILRRLLEPHVPPQVPVDNLWQTRLPTKVMRTKRKRTERPGPAKKPPRPPNAFILYRKDKQKSVQEREVGITNNEVSKVIGDMWKQESQEVKDHYQALAQQSREQHQRDYPGYKYAPRRPGERKRRGVHHEIVFGDSETASNTEESLSFDMRDSPVDYGMSPTPSGDYFRFASNGSYYQDMLGVPGGIDSPDEYNLSLLHPAQNTPCVAAISDAERGWANTPPLDQPSELCLDAGHPDLDFESTNSYSNYQENTFEREPIRFQSVAVDGNYKFMNAPISTPSALTSPMEWATQQALMVEDIYSGSTGWMSPPRSLHQGT